MTQTSLIDSRGLLCRRALGPPRRCSRRSIFANLFTQHKRPSCFTVYVLCNMGIPQNYEEIDVKYVHSTIDITFDSFYPSLYGLGLSLHPFIILHLITRPHLVVL